jgi:tetratricopeptide (TPR) repeat protein
MHRAANTNRFLIDFSSEREFGASDNAVSLGGLPQRTVVSLLAEAANSRHVFNQLAQRLIRLAEYAYSLRDMKTVQEASELLANLPITPAWHIGQYYQALVIKRNGRADEAQGLLETVADNAPLGYRARAIHTLGVIRHEQGHLDDALRLYAEASRAISFKKRPGFLTTLLVNLQISVIQSSTGDHKGTLDSLERLSPLVRLVATQQPLYFYFYQNALAVELGDLGRIAEAEAACAIALASPFASAYPEWSETRDEIAAKRVSATPSVVAINRTPELAPSPQAEPQHKPKPVGRLAFSSTACKRILLQRASTAIAAAAAISNNGTPQSILDRVLICIGSRAPPARA